MTTAFVRGCGALVFACLIADRSWPTSRHRSS